MPLGLTLRYPTIKFSEKLFYEDKYETSDDVKTELSYGYIDWIGNDTKKARRKRTKYQSSQLIY
uniref:Uncharacterized protein n=1 Tax=Heterorhabditis bacteriophora TaxID=37862 RepID=A0A1I7XE75_HETBA